MPGGIPCRVGYHTSQLAELQACCRARRLQRRMFSVVVCCTVQRCLLSIVCSKHVVVHAAVAHVPLCAFGSALAHRMCSARSSAARGLSDSSTALLPRDVNTEQHQQSSHIFHPRCTPAPWILPMCAARHMRRRQGILPLPVKDCRSESCTVNSELRLTGSAAAAAAVSGNRISL
jgi:hypothetical protein